MGRTFFKKQGDLHWLSIRQVVLAQDGLQTGNSKGVCGFELNIDWPVPMTDPSVLHITLILSTTNKMENYHSKVLCFEAAFKM